MTKILKLRMNLREVSFNFYSYFSDGIEAARGFAGLVLVKLTLGVFYSPENAP